MQIKRMESTNRVNLAILIYIIIVQLSAQQMMGANRKVQTECIKIIVESFNLIFMPFIIYKNVIFKFIDLSSRV